MEDVILKKSENKQLLVSKANYVHQQYLAWHITGEIVDQRQERLLVKDVIAADDGVDAPQALRAQIVVHALAQPVVRSLRTQLVTCKKKIQINAKPEGLRKPQNRKNVSINFLGLTG